MYYVTFSNIIFKVEPRAMVGAIGLELNRGGSVRPQAELEQGLALEA